MKERITNAAVALFVFAGIMTIGFSAKILLPTWAFYSILGVLLFWILYDVSKPEKKKKHYWLYVIQYDEKVYHGVISTSEYTFKLPQNHVDRLHDMNNISVIEISKETFDLIMSKE